jgi:hypothetical protein
MMKTGKSMATSRYRWSKADTQDLRRGLGIFSRLTGSCYICDEDVLAEERAAHLELHRYQRENGIHPRPYELDELTDATLSAWRSDPYISRRLGVETIWQQLDGRHSVEDIIQRLNASPHTDVPAEVVRWAAALPEGPWTKGRGSSERPDVRGAVIHLHRQGFLAGEIADRLGLKLAHVDQALERSGADWGRWLERCCFPGWGSAPLWPGRG